MPPTSCLPSSPLFPSSLQCSTSEGAAKSSQSQGDTGDDTTSISSTTTTQSTIEEESQEGRWRLHKAILDLVYSLSSDISMKKNTMGLNL